MWSTACKKSLERLKKSFTSAPILYYFDPEIKIVMETDTSNLVVIRVLSQYDDDDDDNDILHPAAYFSRKHSPAEINYEIYDKKPPAIVRAFKEWCPLLEGSPHTIEVISDHQNLTYFTTNRLLNYCQTRWSEFLSCFDFKIDYRPRKAYGKANPLISQGQRSDKDSDLQEVYHTQTLLKSHNLSLLADIPPPNRNSTFYDLLQTMYEADPFSSEILQMLQNRRRHSKQISLRECEQRNE
jgi:hypothetical protein